MFSVIRDSTNIWTNYSPYPTCVHALIGKYNKPDDIKPTVHVARIYTASNGLTHIIESLQCLGKLEHEGFSVQPWNFNELKAPDGVPVFLDTCLSKIIHTMLTVTSRQHIWSRRGKSILYKILVKVLVLLLGAASDQ